MSRFVSCTAIARFVFAVEASLLARGYSQRYVDEFLAECECWMIHDSTGRERLAERAKSRGGLVYEASKGHAKRRKS